MRLRSFHGPNMTDAMRQVRDALGDHAIIVATRDDDMGGVRVTAAVDEVAVKANGMARAAAMVPDTDTDNDLIEGLADCFYKHGLSAVLSEKLLATAVHYAANDPVLALAAAFDAHMQFRPILDGKATKPLMLIGPPGAGKTLSTAKMATAAKMLGQPVSVITTDTVRAGGISQLAAFTNLLKLKLLEIEDAGALRDTLSVHGGGNLVLIDTAGCNPFDKQDRKDLKDMLAKNDVEAVLVMPAGYEIQEGSDLAAAFRELGASSILLTRGDMTRRFGSALSIAHETKLPLAGISRSPDVTKPLESLNPVSTARLLLPEAESKQQGATSNKPTGTHA
ncbi:MAG: GTPase [Alphaproteobacteria bacterium]|nr:GTPase [Alphaproteobacteria bacterium]